MSFMLDIQIDEPPGKINYKDTILLIGSCFTEHIGNRLQELKFKVLQNPNGILFDPSSVATSIISYVQHKKYSDKELFFMNELWQSWQHHSIFSNIDQQGCLNAINISQEHAHSFLKKADWLIITLGSSFSYRLVENNMAVANCHRAPSQCFNKHLMAIVEINSLFENTIIKLQEFNKEIQIILTISPVRHIRDGLIENNRSKSRLIESVHHLKSKFKNIYYFPAYELVIDVLRDYRFYDIDMVHPNYSATEFVLQKFTENFIDGSSQEIMKEIKQIIIAKKHRSLYPSTSAHKEFLHKFFEKTNQLKSKFPFLDFEEEILHFSK